MKLLRLIVTNIIHSGVTQSTALPIRRRIFIVNQISLIFVLLAAPYFAIFYSLQLTAPAFWVIPSVLAYMGCIVLNKFNKPDLAALGIILFSCIIILYYSCALGKTAGAHYVYFALVLLPLILFGIKKKRLSILSFLLPISTLLVLEYTNYSLFYNEHLSLIQTKVISIFAAITTFSIIIGSAFFYHTSKEKAEEDLMAANSNIEKAYINLQTAYDDLQQSNSIIDSLSQQASMGALVRGIAHEVKNPLAAIYSSCSNLLAEPLSENVQMEIKAIQTSVFQLDYLTNTLLNHSGKMVVGNQWIQLNDILSQLLKLVDNEAFIRKISIHRHLQKNIPRIMGNTAYVSQAVLNLLVNALEHTPHGSITVRSHSFVEMGLLKVGIQVQDNGTGIPSDLLPHIFDPNKSFGKSVSAKTTPQINAGLGLFFVKRVMDAHDGEARVSSVLVKGKNFELVFDGETC